MMHRLNKQTLLRFLLSMRLPLGIALFSAALQALNLADSLRFDRELIAAGDWWLLLSANLVHLGWNHWLLNCAGLLLIYMLFGEDFSVAFWLALLVFDSIALALCLYWFKPDLYWYVGLSGSLHGLFAAGLYAEWRRSKGFALLLGGALLAKLIWEQLYGAMPGSAEAAGGPVVVEAHSYGALWGVVWMCLYLAWQACRRRTTP